LLHERADLPLSDGEATGQHAAARTNLAGPYGGVWPRAIDCAEVPGCAPSSTHQERQVAGERYPASGHERRQPLTPLRYEHRTPSQGNIVPSDRSIRAAGISH
jgi:hypothetical protein